MRAGARIGNIRLPADAALSPINPGLLRDRMRCRHPLPIRQREEIPMPRHLPTPPRRINRAFDLALAGVLVLVLSAAVLAPGLADSDSGDACVLRLSGQPQGCGPAH
jgi:hypothetical protein